MSLLHQDTPEDIDDAALGEEYAKGSGHLILAGIIAAVVVTAVIAIYVFAGQKPPAATGEVEQMWAHPQHTESSGVDANGEAMAKESFDQVFVFALVKLHNQSDQPIFCAMPWLTPRCPMASTPAMRPRRPITTACFSPIRHACAARQGALPGVARSNLARRWREPSSPHFA